MGETRREKRPPVLQGGGFGLGNCRALQICRACLLPVREIRQFSSNGTPLRCVQVAALQLVTVTTPAPEAAPVLESVSGLPK